MNENGGENMNISIDDFPTCNYHSDCFANREGKCIALTDTNFNRGHCPFYKTEEKLNEQRNPVKNVKSKR